MFKIYWINMAKATGDKRIGTRPVVSVEQNGKILTVYEITTRNKADRYHAHMNNYLIRGYCDCGTAYKVDEKYIKSYVRDCTLSEYKAISDTIAALKPRDSNKQAV